MTDWEKTKGTIRYINKCIDEYSNRVEWWQIVFSLDGWAEHHATMAFDSEVVEYAPELSAKLEILKESIEREINIFEADIDRLIKVFDLNLQEAKLHLKLEPYLSAY